ncbi:MAG: hypothetical protein AAF283_02380, partial [Cyanobacteria bacterium P01_A01_bin.70]
MKQFLLKYLRLLHLMTIHQILASLAAQRKAALVLPTIQMAHARPPSWWCGGIVGSGALALLALGSGGYAQETAANQEIAQRLLIRRHPEQTRLEAIPSVSTEEQGMLTASDTTDRGQFRLCDLAGNEQARFDGNFQSFTPDQQGLLTSSYDDGQSRLYDFTGTEQARFVGQFRSFTPNQQGLITSLVALTVGSDGQSRLYDFTGTEQARFVGQFQSFTPDQQGLVTYSYNDEQSRLYDLTGTEQARFSAFFLDFTPDGQGLLTYSYQDDQGRIYDLAGIEQVRFEGEFLSFTPDR